MKIGIKDFIKEFILEQDDDVIVISPDDYLQLVFDVGGIASRIPLLKEYRNKKIVIDGPLNVKDNKKIGELSGVIRIKGRLDITNSNVPTLDGITVDGYVSKYGSTLWENEQKKRLRELLDDQEERRSENDWDIRNGEDESERTEAFYLYLNEIDFLMSNQKRNDLICKLANKLDNNTIIMVDRIDHGENLMNILNNISNKTCYYIKGSTEIEEREKIRHLMNEKNDIIVIAISKIFSTGINIPNLHNIYFSSYHCGREHSSCHYWCAFVFFGITWRPNRFLAKRNQFF
jgi:hypothetical protein